MPEDRDTSADEVATNVMSKTVDEVSFSYVVSRIGVERKAARVSDGCCSAVQGAEDLILPLSIDLETEDKLL